MNETQRWQICQDLIQQLADFLSRPARPSHAEVQAALSAAAQKLAAIDAAAVATPVVPLVVPQVVPAAPTVGT